MGGKSSKKEHHSRPSRGISVPAVATAAAVTAPLWVSDSGNYSVAKAVWVDLTTGKASSVVTDAGYNLKANAKPIAVVAGGGLLLAWLAPKVGRMVHASTMMPRSWKRGLFGGR